MLRLELHKLFRSRLSLILLIFTVCLFPVILKIVSHLTATTDNVPEGLFPDKVANAILVYAQSYFFVPVWILLVIGTEFANGHVNKIVFIKSRTYYFDSKLLYCILVTFMFTILAALTFFISIQFSPYKFLSVDPVYFGLFIAQFAVSTFLQCTILLILVLILRSATVSIIVYLGWSFIESIAVTLIKGFYGIHLKYLPMQIPKSLYTKFETHRSTVYFNALSSNLFEVAALLLVCAVGLILFRRSFSSTQFKPLSD